MIFVIVPLGKGTKEVTAWVIRVILYTLGSMLGATLFALLMGLIGQGLHALLPGLGFAWVTALLGVLAFIFALKELRIIPSTLPTDRVAGACKLDEAKPSARQHPLRHRAGRGRFHLYPLRQLLPVAPLGNNCGRRLTPGRINPGRHLRLLPWPPRRHGRHLHPPRRISSRHHRLANCPPRPLARHKRCSPLARLGPSSRLLHPLAKFGLLNMPRLANPRPLSF